jgi:transcription initiation factor IIE alpha subunit
MNYKEVLRKIPKLSEKTLNACIRMLEADMSNPAFYGPDADVKEQFRHQTLLDLMHAERGYRLGYSGLTG